MTASPKKTGRMPEAKTREAILRAAIDEFADRGFAGARTENIAKAAEVNKAMLHYYYHDKETLYNAVLESLYGSLDESEDLIERLTKAPLNSVQHIHIFLKVIVAKHGDPKSKPFRCILAWELAAGQNNLKRVAQKYLVPRILSLSEVIARGIKAGELECKNPTLAVYSMISQVVFYYMHRGTYEETSIYKELYENVEPRHLLQFLLQNFIAAYATNRKIEWKLPADIEKMADELAAKMSENPLLQA
ncbi:MAG: TetR family transcriptional regulator [Spirochaetes bacterium]|nr:TetR family transcriptional regulator [Spirochaetota bacterium]MBX3723763.1 TetR family transcriptional regulator [Turneriella sp.]